MRVFLLIEIVLGIENEYLSQFYFLHFAFRGSLDPAYKLDKTSALIQPTE